MGLLDIFKGKRGGAGDERALMRHAERVMDKRAMSPDRFGSIEFLAKLATPEAWRALLPRFNFNVDPTITDREEKQYAFEALTGHPDTAAEPVKEFLRTAQSLTWPIKMLKAMLSREELVAELLDMLKTFDTGYEKNFERKVQLLMALEDEPDARVSPAVVPYLADFTEDVRFHAIRCLIQQDDDTVSKPLTDLLLRDGSMRIRTTIVDGLAERGWPIDAQHRGAVGGLLRTVPTGPWTLDEAGKIVRP